MSEYPLPSAVQQLLATPAAKTHNIGLFLDRFIGWDKQWDFDDKHGEGKKGAYKHVIEVAQAFGDSQEGTALMAGLRQRQAQQLSDIQRVGCETWSKDLKTDWRLTVGLGTPGVLETGLTTHRVYGIPYIPGSSLKGLTRAWAFWQIAESVGIYISGEKSNGKRKTPAQRLDDLLSTPMGNPNGSADERRACEKWAKLRDQLIVDEARRESFTMAAEQFQAVFGAQDEAGSIIFFDALPVEAPKLKLDVMNPHYGDYYQEKVKYPVEWLSPVPVYFLTIEQTKFGFSLAARTRAANALIDTTRQWLLAALENMGAGGKTTAGYGYFSDKGAVPPSSPAAPTAATTKSSGGAAPSPAPAEPIKPPKDLQWQKGRISKDRRSVQPEGVTDPARALRFSQDRVVGPKGWTYGAKEAVEFGVEVLTDGKQRVWVKKPYYQVT